MIFILFYLSFFLFLFLLRIFFILFIFLWLFYILFLFLMILRLFWGKFGNLEKENRNWRKEILTLKRIRYFFFLFLSFPSLFSFFSSFISFSYSPFSFPFLPLSQILNHALKSLTTKYSTSLYLLLSFSFYYPSLFLSIFSSHFLPYTLATLPTLFLQLTDFIYFIIFIFILNPFRVGNELFWFPSGCEKEENHTNSSSSLSSSPEWLEELFLFREELMKPETVDYY